MPPAYKKLSDGGDEKSGSYEGNVDTSVVKVRCCPASSSVLHGKSRLFRLGRNDYICFVFDVIIIDTAITQIFAFWDWLGGNTSLLS